MEEDYILRYIMKNTKVPEYISLVFHGGDIDSHRIMLDELKEILLKYIIGRLEEMIFCFLKNKQAVK